jgi:serine protease DegQ
VRRLLALLVAAALVLGACGDDGLAGILDDDAPAEPEVRDEPATDDDQEQEQEEDTTATDEPTGGAAGLEVVPELVRELTPSVVAVLVGTGGGSGVVYRSDGLIVTNEHVVAEAGPGGVEVVLADGERLPAEVVASDTRSDLAVLRVDREGLPDARFAEEPPEVGEMVIAVGNPLGFESSVSQGIISGLQRTLPVPGPQGQALVDLIQTDAALSPGNSGGPLVDGSGRVVGINVAIIPPQAGAVALGFAIPSTTVLNVVSQLLETGEVRHPFLGVQAVPISAQVAERLGLATDDGVLLLEVVEPGPAADAGLRSGDVIVAMAGEEVRSMQDFLSILNGLDVGDEIEVEVVRGDEELTVPAVLGERPA